MERWTTAQEFPSLRKRDSMPPSAAPADLASKSKSEPPPGSILTGKQEHYLKRELIARQTQYEISELASPTALQRFGAPFRSDAGEVDPEDSDLPLLRYIFVNHVRNFPFLDQAREKEFWQDKLQVFLESFATKHISSSEDRLEETKRKKLALKAQKVVELMMVSGIPTASGYEERIRFEEMEIIDRQADEAGIMVNVPEGREINGWDVNVAGVRMVPVRHAVRKKAHAHFLIRVKERGKPERYVARRYGDFVRMHKQMRTELPGKVLPPLPRKNRKTTSGWFGGADDDSDADSMSSASTQTNTPPNGEKADWTGGLISHFGISSHSRAPSVHSLRTPSEGGRRPARSQSGSPAPGPHHVTLHREENRVSLRAFLRNFLQNEQRAKSVAMRTFLTNQPLDLGPDDIKDIDMRKELDEKRILEAQRFYEIARQRARELDVHMEKFRRSIVESNGLTKLFREIRVKNTIAELSPEYQKFAEWLRIEVAATIYHLFLSEDNSPELFAQAKRIHSLVPYTALKQTIRFANPAAVMKGVLDLFLAQPFGARSLMQRIFGLAINDGIRAIQRSIDSLSERLDEPVLTAKLKAYTEASSSTKDVLHKEAEDEGVDLLVVVLRTDLISPEPEPRDIERIFNAYVAFNHAVESTPDEALRQGAELFAHLKQLLKLHIRLRDKVQMSAIIEEPVTLQLFRDLFTIFYEPLVRVYKSANVYSSVTDFANFADDAIRVIEAAQRQDVAADPNQTVQSFIDLCERHQDDFYKFVHEVHIHDNGLFDQLMGWLEGILEFLRHGPAGGGKLDMNALVQGAVDGGAVDAARLKADVDRLVDWQMERKKWHADKTRRKMAAEDVSGGARRGRSFGGGGGGGTFTGSTAGGLRSSDFGINELDIQDMGLAAGDSDGDDYHGDGGGGGYSDDDDDYGDGAGGGNGASDPIEAERRRRRRMQEALKSKAGEPKKPEVGEVHKLGESFVSMLRSVLAR